MFPPRARRCSQAEHGCLCRQYLEAPQGRGVSLRLLPPGDSLCTFYSASFPGPAQTHSAFVPVLVVTSSPQPLPAVNLSGSEEGHLRVSQLLGPRIGCLRPSFPSSARPYVGEEPWSFWLSGFPDTISRQRRLHATPSRVASGEPSEAVVDVDDDDLFIQDVQRGDAPALTSHWTSRPSPSKVGPHLGHIRE